VYQEVQLLVMPQTATQTLEFLETAPNSSLPYCFYFYGAMSTLNFYSPSKSGYCRWSSDPGTWTGGGTGTGYLWTCHEALLS